MMDDYPNCDFSQWFNFFVVINVECSFLFEQG
jgi:hypothetical protein